MIATEDIAAIRRGWAVAATVPEDTASAFYSHLFRIDPAARSLFREDMDAQGRKLAGTLDTIVDALDSPETLIGVARQLALRHVGYGVEPRHYDAVGAALIAALSDLLGDAFGEEERCAWTRVYGALAAVMKDAAYGEPADARG